MLVTDSNRRSVRCRTFFRLVNTRNQSSRALSLNNVTISYKDKQKPKPSRLVSPRTIEAAKAKAAAKRQKRDPSDRARMSEQFNPCRKGAISQGNRLVTESHTQKPSQL
jgi:hypothetical protein